MTGTSLVAYEERFAQDADNLAAREARSGTFLSVKGGVFTLNGETLGTEVCVVVIDSYFENNYFPPDRPFDEANPLPPVCYAFHYVKADMAPHPSMQVDLNYFAPQSAQCAGCPHNEWGSAARGRGKACQNRERLIVVPAGYFQPKRGSRDTELHLFDDMAHFARADAVGLRTPVTSVENWSKYVTEVAAAHRRPPYAVYTRAFIEPHPKTQFKLHFEYLDNLPDSLFEVIVKRVDAQQAQPFTGFLPPERVSNVIDQQGRPQGRVAGLRGLRAQPTQPAPQPSQRFGR